MEIGKPFKPQEVFPVIKHFVGPYFPNCLMDCEELTIYEKYCWVVLSRFIGKNGEYCPSYPTIAKKGKMSLNTAKKAIKGLKEKNFLKITTGGIGRSNYYQLLWHRIFAEALRFEEPSPVRPDPVVVDYVEADPVVVDPQKTMARCKIKRGLESETPKSLSPTPGDQWQTFLDFVQEKENGFLSGRLAQSQLVDRSDHRLKIALGRAWAAAGPRHEARLRELARTFFGPETILELEPEASN
jgi:hypothetical protein